MKHFDEYQPVWIKPTDGRYRKRGCYLRIEDGHHLVVCGRLGNERTWHVLDGEVFARTKGSYKDEAKLDLEPSGNED